MKPNSQIVYGGGRITRQIAGKPKARFFGFLSVIWLLVSFCASVQFWDGWPNEFGHLEWLCGALLVPQPAFVLLAGYFLLTEKRRIFTQHHPNPDRDLRKLR